MSHYIKEQWQLAAQSVRHSSPDTAMEAYYGCIDQMCRYSEKQLLLSAAAQCCCLRHGKGVGSSKRKGQWMV